MKENLATFFLLKEVQARSPLTHYVSDEELKIIQKELVIIMDEIHQFCEDNNITYFLGGGAALGAVRHKGFIPWDDDIDIFMPRKDYNRFREIFCKEKRDRYYMQDVIMDKQYNSVLMKVRRKGTVYRELVDPEPEKSGLFIDIYSIENVYDNLLARKLQQMIVDGLQFICSCVRMRDLQDMLLPLMKDSEKKIIKKKVMIGRFFSFFSLKRWLHILEKALQMNKNEHSKLITVPISASHFKGELCSRSIYFPPRELEFEGRKFWGMNSVEKYLTAHYGDYMKLPSEKNRERHSVMEFSISNNETGERNERTN